MIDNVDQLIEQANQIESESERVQFVLNYFFNNVQYNYAYLVADGYMQETISELYPFDRNKDLVMNPFKKGKITIPLNGVPQEFNDSYCLSYRISKGESQLLNRVVELSENCNGDKEYFFSKLEGLLTEVLESHLENSSLVNSNISRLISTIKKDMSYGRVIQTGDDQFFITSDIKKVLINYMLEPNKHFPPIIENGLIKSGVCQHFADFLQDFLPKIGINAVRIDGTSELGHAWIAAIIDGELKSIDLTRAIFIRDGFKNIPTEQKSSDWLIADFEDTFKMQQARTISSVGMDENGPIMLPEVMNGSNFDSELLKRLVIERCNMNLGIKMT